MRDPLDLAAAARLALTAAVGHRAEEQSQLSGLSPKQRRLLDRVYSDINVYSVLQEHFAARVLEQWGRAMEQRASEDDKTPTVIAFVVPPEAKGEADGSK